MSDRVEAAVRELAEALRAEMHAELAARQAGPPELLSIPQAARRLGIGRSMLYDLIGRGEVRSLRIGKRRLVPADSLAALAAADR